MTERRFPWPEEPAAGWSSLVKGQRRSIATNGEAQRANTLQTVTNGDQWRPVAKARDWIAPSRSPVRAWRPSIEERPANTWDSRFVAGTRSGEISRWSSLGQVTCDVPPAGRRVCKFGRARFAGESCRSPGGVPSGSGGRRNAAGGRSTRFPDGLERRTAIRRTASPSKSGASARSRTSAATGRRALASGPEKSLANARASLESLSAVRRDASCGRNAGGTGSGFPWKSATTEFTNPTGSPEPSLSQESQPRGGTGEGSGSASRPPSGSAWLRRFRTALRGRGCLSSGRRSTGA